MLEYWMGLVIGFVLMGWHVDMYEVGLVIEIFL